MGLESFYLAVKTAIFSSRGSAPHPALRLGARPPDPRVRSQRPQNLELGYRQKSPLPVRPRKKGRCKAYCITSSDDGTDCRLLDTRSDDGTD